MKFLDHAKQQIIYRQFKIIKSFGKSSPKTNSLSISFCDMQHEMAEAFLKYFYDRDNVEILQGNILNLSCDALVSPANSFGEMSGGLDKAIDDFYGGNAQPSIRHAIGERFFGELAVGNAIILPMNTKQFPLLIVAPTMRIPGNVQRTINAYLAMRAVLVAISQHNKQANGSIHNVAIPGFCCGIGGMSPQESAEQMRVAYDMIIEEKWKTVIHPALAPYAMREG